MIAPADLRALGVLPCGCGKTYKRTSGPWLCGPGCVPTSEGRPASAVAGRSRIEGGGVATLPREGSTPSPRPSKPMPGRHARGNAVCDALAQQIAAASWLPARLSAGVVREYRFAPPRRWRFDLALPLVMWAVEVDGGAFTGGHSRGAAYEKECEKFNEATLLGWRVLRVTPKMVKQGSALALVRRAVGGAK